MKEQIILTQQHDSSTEFFLRFNTYISSNAVFKQLIVTNFLLRTLNDASSVTLLYILTLTVTKLRSAFLKLYELIGINSFRFVSVVA